MGMAGRARGPAGRHAGRRATGARGLDRPDGGAVASRLPLPDVRPAPGAWQRDRSGAGRPPAPGDRTCRGRGHLAALRAVQPVVRAILEPAGLPPTVVILAAVAPPHPPLATPVISTPPLARSATSHPP